MEQGSFELWVWQLFQNEEGFLDNVSFVGVALGLGIFHKICLILAVLLRNLVDPRMIRGRFCVISLFPHVITFFHCFTVSLFHCFIRTDGTENVSYRGALLLKMTRVGGAERSPSSAGIGLKT